VLAAGALLLVPACAGTATTARLSASPTVPPAAAGASPVATLAGPATATPAPSPAPAAPPAPPHVMVVVLENREYDAVIGVAPHLTALARSSGLAIQAYATSHPSEPNYLALVTGSTQGITDDGDHLVDAPSIAGQLRARGIGWRAYMGGLPRPCDTVTSAGLYAKKHDPFLLVREVVDDPSMCASVLPMDGLASDLTSGSAPPFLFVSPDLCADGHDCSTLHADVATAALVQEVTASAWYAQAGRIVVLWDEGSSDAGCCQGAHGGHVAVIVVSGEGSAGAGTTLDTPLDHAGVLRGIEELYGLAPLADAACPCSGDLLPLLQPGR
jgi:phosphatidylinositol-3-phosphatase